MHLHRIEAGLQHIKAQQQERLGPSLGAVVRAVDALTARLLSREMEPHSKS